MKTIKVRGKNTHIPTSWVEVTAEMWLRLIQIDENSREFELIAALTGEPEEFFLKSKDTLLDVKFFKELEWYTKPINLITLERKDEVVVGDKTIPIPKDLGFKTLGQKMLLQQSMRENKDNIDAAILRAFAIYIAPLYYEKEFDGDTVEPFIEEFVNKMPIIEVYPIGSFFLQSLLDYQKWRVGNYIASMTQSRLEQA